MKKEIKKIKDGIIQITTLDERHYQINDKFVPSVTWICEYYPKGVAFFRWLADKGWSQAEQIKSMAGEKGSKVHQAIESLLDGKTVRMESKFINKETGEEEELNVEEYEAIMSFVNWFNEVKPEIVAKEVFVYNKKEGYAGMLDLLCRINGRPHIIDFKISQNIWPSHKLQVSAYKHAILNSGIAEENINTVKDTKLAILQVGYRRNKKGWKFNEIEDKFDLFLAAKQIWSNECANIQPKQRDFPEKLSIKI